MKRILFLLLSLLFIAVTPPALRAAEESREKATDETAQQKEQYEKSMEKRLGTIGKELDELMKKANAGSGEAKKELNRYMKEAKKKQKAAVRKLEEMRTASKERWREFTSDMNKAADDFEEAYEKAKKRFTE